MQIRKKPVIVEAIEYDAALGNNRVVNWLAQFNVSLKGWIFHDGEITIPTLEGSLKAVDKDWIIRGVKGEFYPCKPDIIRETYEIIPPGMENGR